MPPPPSTQVLCSSAAHTMTASSSGSSIASSGLFSAATKAETLRIAGTTCWACSTRAPEICHVVPHHDPQVLLEYPIFFELLANESRFIQIPLWEQAGLFTFNYKNTQNTIPLCGSCHIEFDMSLDPGYVFFPTDIQYFIDFERRDRARREQIATDTAVPLLALSRQVPTSADYKQHGIDSNQISPTAIGGLYNRVFLKQFLHNGQIPGIERTFSTPKEWHGAPLASIRRASAALASPRFFMIVDAGTRHMLEELRQLYFGDDRISSEQASLRDVYRPQVQTNQKRQLEDQTNRESGRYDKKAKHQDTGFAGTASAVNQCREDTDWVLGPESTTNDVVKLYAPVFSSY
ncbi:hypothetical protein N7457_008643 [Penicillium paradoxum]|uniref:uncharacterized protein n=1 Tax=Penicillium paradoxum TaxID=176176 RepID=UPI0025490A2B|nr:uncharacterized protein N7457_008643 [Penicillium paradoxum]KAJ5773747.1 hypothetical protein N7457_008643 [Penicillium paradoxum]